MPRYVFRSIGLVGCQIGSPKKGSNSWLSGPRIVGPPKAAAEGGPFSWRRIFGPGVGEGFGPFFWGEGGEGGVGMVWLVCWDFLPGFFVRS